MSALSATVIGTVFIDCKGFARDTYNPAGRNLGTIRFVHGGVGRNVAENLGLMGVPTRLVSSVDASGLGQEVLDRLETSGVNTQYTVKADREGMGMWMAVLDEKGDLAGSISQMPDLSAMERTITEHGESIVGESSHILLELDLNVSISASILELAGRFGKPVYGIPGNLEVILQRPDLLSKLAGFICNHVEAERLLGESFIDLTPDRQKTALQRYSAGTGLPAIVVTMGAQGAAYYDRASDDFGIQPVFPVRVVDSSGAGDSFFSGTVMGLMHGLSWRNAVVCGTKVAGWTIESPENNCKDLRRHLQQDAIIRSLLPSVY